MTGSNIYIGCCGAYCKTCKPFTVGYCKGCKLGFDTGERNIEKIKCKIKACCFKDKKLDTCADCIILPNCSTIGEWFSKKGYKYHKYKQAIEFINENGYATFIRIADKWSNAYGKYKRTQ
jgi:hypothetical protein